MKQNKTKVYREEFKPKSRTETIIALRDDYLVIEIVTVEDNHTYINYKIEAMPNRFSINLTGPLDEKKLIAMLEQDFFKEMETYLAPILPW